MLKIRFQRIGKKGQAYFRVVVIEHTVKPKGKYLELLGSYDPHMNNLKVKIDRIKHWISNGAQMSATVNNLLVGNKLIEGKKVRSWKAQPKKNVKEEAKVEAKPTEVSDNVESAEAKDEPTPEKTPVAEEKKVTEESDDKKDAVVKEKTEDKKES